MAWDDDHGHWFSLGRIKIPCLDQWKLLSAVKGAPRKGAILNIDEALTVAERADINADWLKKQLLAFELYLACDAMLRGIGAFDLQAKQRRDAVEQLRDRARQARDYFSASYALTQTVLTKPVDVFKLIAIHASPQLIGISAFRNFQLYARAHWHYVGKSHSSGEDLLAGKTSSIPCGGIANALRIVLGIALPEASPAKFTTLSGRLVTRRKYHCFDPVVKGNLRDRNGDLEGPCFFNNHYFLFWPYTGLYYDACMATTYVTENDVVEERPTETVPGLTALLATAKENATRSDSLYIHDEWSTAPGFESTWVRVAIADVTGADALTDLVPASLRDKLQATSPDARAIADFCAGVH